MALIDRRTFAQSALTGVAAATLPSWASAAQQKKLKIGITMLIWGAGGRTPENLETAM